VLGEKERPSDVSMELLESCGIELMVHGANEIDIITEMTEVEERTLGPVLLCRNGLARLEIASRGQ
jgi:hypothetical protein